MQTGKALERPVAASGKLLAVGCASGVLLTFLCVPQSHWTVSPWPWLALGGALLWMCFPSAGLISRRLAALAEQPPCSRWLLNLSVFTASLTVLFVTAWCQSRSFVPTWHDHHMYLLQAQMAASGRLTMPAHELADFFETFHVFTHGIYAPMYFPGASLMHVPAVWLHAPYWLFPLLIAAGIVTLLFEIVTELQDWLAGLLAAVGMLAVSQFRFLSLDIMSHTVVLLLSLGMVRAWLAWRGSLDPRWAAVMGLCAGWGAITRPIDALSYAAPIGLAMAWELRGQTARRWLVTVTALVAPAVPFLALQAAFNQSVTGSVFTTPAAHYYRTTWHYDTLEHGTTAQVAMTEVSSLPQKQLYFEHFVKPSTVQVGLADRLTGEAPRRTAALFALSAPGGWALVLLPLGCLALGDLRRMVLVAQPLLFLAGYLVLVPDMLDHYYVLCAPVVIALVSFGRQRLVESATWIPGAASGLALALAISAVGWFPGFRSICDENLAGYRLLRYVHATLPTKIQQPAVVLFRYHPSQRNSFHSEPVYNVNAAWPDDAPIVKAHDLGGKRDIQIAEYYAQRQPERRFYLFDRQDDVTYRIKDLGLAGEFAAQLKTIVAQEERAKAAAARQEPAGRSAK